jgi:hypothetical protein
MAEASFGGILTDLTNAGAALGSNAIASLGGASQVTVQTQFSPPITFSPGASGGAQSNSSVPDIVNPLYYIKPAVTLTLPSGQQIGPIAPWGVPSANYFPYMLALGAAGAGALLTLWGAKKVARTAFYAGGAFLVGGYLYNRMGGQLPGLPGGASQ